ncbi:ferritin [Parabacteroides chinchillae]|uniref:Ferritin n=1 Tax=Parabacteroides chinchillae TaxID=871327 RepID=A0A8G2F5V9_9BACT|nr:ferritin [Parabacteroides chinchillae]SEG15774.1 ferritin [Parabacteroides chinchillae]
MILSKKLTEAFNVQVNAEMWSSNLYLSMSVYFQKEGLNGFAHWMRKQADEEMEHAHKMIDFAIDRGGDITIGQINVVPSAWGNPLEVFEHVYKHEIHVSEMIDKMMDIAEAEKDHAVRDFLFGFVREQVEEESTAKSIVDELKHYGECHFGIMDHKLGKR